MKKLFYLSRQFIAYQNAVPLIDLKIAAGGFSTDQFTATAADFDWIALDGHTRPGLDHGGRYTVKVYDSQKLFIPDDTWHHTTIHLKPDSHDPTFAPILVEANPNDELSIIAELVEVLG